MNTNKKFFQNLNIRQKFNDFYWLYLIKFTFININIIYKGFNFLKLLNNKLLKFIILSSNTPLKYFKTYALVFVKNLVIFTLNLLSFITNLIFKRILNFKLLQKKIYKVLNHIFYLKQLLIFKNLSIKRKNIVNPRLKKNKIKLIYKGIFKKKLFKHVEKMKKIKLKKIQKFMLTRKLSRKEIINENLRNSRSLVSKNILKMLNFEDVIFNFTNKLNNNLLTNMSKASYILENLIRILYVFKKNKKINYVKKIVGFISNKLDLFTNRVDGISTYLDTIKNLDTLFKSLFFKKFIRLLQSKKNKKRYLKLFYKYHFFNSILIIFSLVKIILLINVINNNNKTKAFIKKIDIFFNLKNYINQYITNIRFI